MDTQTLAQTIGYAFRAARTARGLTTAQAAELLRLQTDFYARIEAGDSLPTISMAARAVEAIGLDPEALFGRPDYERQRIADNLEVAGVCLRALDERDQAMANVVIAAKLTTELHAEKLSLASRAESMAAECESLQREIGRVRTERDALRNEAREEIEEGERLQAELSRVRMERDSALEEARMAHDRIDEIEAERETLLLLSALQDEDPDVTECRYCAACARCPVHDENPDQLRLSLGTGLTPAGPIIAVEVQR